MYIKYSYVHEIRKCVPCEIKKIYEKVLVLY